MKKILFILCVLAPITQANVIKCHLDSDKIVYQAKPCVTAIKQEIIEIKKSDPSEVAATKAKLKAWEADFVVRDATRTKTENEQQAKLAKLRAQRNMQNSYQQQHQLPRYYSAHPYYIPHHYNTSHRFGRQK
jgi:Skp family chaperone for outer membrane proteins